MPFLKPLVKQTTIFLDRVVTVAGRNAEFGWTFNFSGDPAHPDPHDDFYSLKRLQGQQPAEKEWYKGFTKNEAVSKPIDNKWGYYWGKEVHEKESKDSSFLFKNSKLVMSSK